MELTSLLAPEYVKCGLAAKTKEAALHEILELGAQNSGVLVTRLAEALAERERLGPLSMAKGTAFPHVRTDGLGELRVVLGTAPEGLDFKAPDGSLIRLVVLFLIPPQHSNLYLEILARFLDLLGKEEVFGRVVRAKTPADLIALLRAASPAPPPSRSPEALLPSPPGRGGVPAGRPPGPRLPVPPPRPGEAPPPPSRFGLLPGGP